MSSRQSGLTEWDDTDDEPPDSTQTESSEPPEALPSYINNHGDAWYEYRDDPLFNEDLIDGAVLRPINLLNAPAGVSKLSQVRLVCGRSLL